MSGFKALPLLLLSILFWAAACSSKCQEDGAFECHMAANEGAEYRACVGGEWVKSTCDPDEVCTKEGCVLLPDRCREPGALRCLDAKRAGKCSKLGRIEIQMAEDGYMCDPAQCGKSDGCFVAGEICELTHNACLDARTLRLCLKGARSTDLPCGAGTGCVAGKCVRYACDNGRLDEGEEAVDCGGLCALCLKCRVDTDCGVDGFCDSASGYVCSKRCRANTDCANSDLWDGEFCRGDGRCSPKVFETYWAVTRDKPTVVLPFDLNDSKAKCDFQILWGDEPEGTDMTTLLPVTDCKVVDNRTHTYAKAGHYKVKIIGIYDGWGGVRRDGEFTEIPVKDTLLAVTSFGPVGLSHAAFWRAKQLVSMPTRDIPDASKLTSLADCFRETSLFNDPIGHWDTSAVTDMKHLLDGAEAFNQPLAGWNTSQVTNMNRMFSMAKAFNQPIESWDVSRVKTMDGMFYWASSFNQSIGHWDVSNVTTMGESFHLAKAFDQDLSAWNIMADVDLSIMFSGSGMSAANLCALKAKGGLWLRSKEVKMAVCP